MKCFNGKCGGESRNGWLCSERNECKDFIPDPEKPALLSVDSQSSGSVFNYVECAGVGCEGWINLFHGDDILCLVMSVEIANQIKASTQRRKQNDLNHRPEEAEGE